MARNRLLPQIWDDDNPVGTSTLYPQFAAPAQPNTTLFPYSASPAEIGMRALLTNKLADPDFQNALGLASGFGTGAIGMAKFVPYKAADMVARAAKTMGLNVEQEGSRLSGSKYLTLSNDTDLSPIKIRFSDHQLPPSYKTNMGEANYEVGPHMDAHSDNWADAVAKASRYFGIDIPGYVKNRLSADYVADPNLAPIPAKAAPAKNPVSDQYKFLETQFPAFKGKLVPGSGVGDIYAKSLAAKYEAANPGQMTWVESLDPNYKPPP